MKSTLTFREIVADSHAAQNHDLVVEDEQLGVVEALLDLDAHVGMNQQRLRQRARPLAQRAPAPVEGHEAPELPARLEVDLLVEKALLGPRQVLVEAAQAVLEDGDVDTPVGGRQQRAGDGLAGIVVAPLEAADADAAAGVVNTTEDARESPGSRGKELDRRGGNGRWNRKTGQGHPGAGESNVGRPTLQSMPGRQEHRAFT